MHLDDAVEAIIATVKRIEAQTAVLIGEPDPPSYEMLQEEIGQRIHGKEWTTLRVPKPLAKVGAALSDELSGGEAFIKPFMVNMADDHYAIDISGAKALIGWEPKHRLLDHLPHIVEELKSNPKEWYRENGLA